MSAESQQVDALVQAAHRLPIKPGLVAFIGRAEGAFIDNVKYAFLECTKREDLTPFFITTLPEERDKLAAQGLSVYLFPEEDAILALARASVLVTDDFSYKFNAIGLIASRAKTVQLWHGVPLKVIGFPELERIEEGTDKYEMIREGYSGYDVLVSTSEYFNEHCFRKAFDAKAFPCWGLPRNDVLFRTPTKGDRINLGPEFERIEKEKADGAKLVMYMPTFRDTGGDPLYDKALDLEVLERFGKANKIIFAVKFHPYVKLNVQSRFEYVRFLDSREDAYPYLGLTDLLITDYSSIYFDYLLLNRPVVFYPYDLEKYLAVDRAMFFPYDSLTPGPSCRTFEELLAEMRAVLLKGSDSHAQERGRVLDLAFDHKDGKAAERVCDFLQTFAHEV